MGRGGKGRKGGRGGGRSRGTGSYADIPQENQKLETYYKDQKIIPEEEWETFMGTIKRTLPTTFRITGSRSHAIDIRNALERDYIPFLTNIEHEGQLVEAPTPLPWYPEHLAWNLSVPKQVIRKHKDFKRFQNFLVYETEVGNISRQEAVSMIPPLLLDVKPEHIVIDMCAAPGSKTGQIIEALHATPEDANDEPAPRGLCIANDADYKRSHMLVHQVKRLNSPCMMVTNQDATLYPNVLVHPWVADPSVVSGPMDANEKSAILKFDRVLADVPCSGDGTIRKNPTVWSSWTPGNALGLHPTQVKILLRSLQMLKVGGRMVYSTCSLNPIENEAVVAEALRQYGASVKLVDVSERLPELKRRNGINDWVVPDGNDGYFASREEVSKDKHKRYPQSLWPPSEDEVKEFNLDRCIRIYPHLQDTGGFFVAVLEKHAKLANHREGKTGSTKWMEEKGITAQEAAAQGTKRAAEAVDEEAPEAKKAKVDEAAVEEETPAEAVMADATAIPKAVPEVGEDSSRGEFRASKKDDDKKIFEEPFKFLPADHPEIEVCKKFYNLSEKFPTDAFMVRNAAGIPTRGIYFTSARAKSILLLNAQEPPRMRFVHAGIKMFTKQDSGAAADEIECKWRVQSEGCRVVAPFIGEDRVVTAPMAAFEILLKEAYPKLSQIGPILRAQLEQKTFGCVVLKVDPRENPALNMSIPIVCPLWKSKASTNLMVSKQDKSAMLLRMYGADAPMPANPSGRKEKEEKGDEVDKQIEEEVDGEIEAALAAAEKEAESG
ncbi:S-adenosyl-L-methionine-dependent methyltransferase [Saitoella complicata NRRL Y-17804]|uniref:S-adenosyl-L-methionine-dependent methyltransferase n=1 Tax=Saitoella complicata (strain BCRC 22490 / CBS 7301 / JCM 7358 / NBRC 10748 / NRRL Y-17804) TaxID=698492 RepID=UPI00086810DF|nr:S-adenosyl-L-methionine-dependent methyltransferase [Saitoella complicata NRRL Y-17804]ODQ52014.1 S-adenosyl-L-methionine-dependent methyltransferase [Saitoella complicata NRRL Y-17804]